MSEGKKTRINTKVLQIVKKVCLATYENAKGYAHLEKPRYDNSKDFQAGQNQERTQTLSILNRTIEENKNLGCEFFDGMFLLKKDLEELDRLLDEELKK